MVHMGSSHYKAHLVSRESPKVLDTPILLLLFVLALYKVTQINFHSFISLWMLSFDVS